jgi:hypothetical protein
VLGQLLVEAFTFPDRAATIWPSDLAEASAG